MLRANHLVIQEKSKEKVGLVEFYFQVWPFCIFALAEPHAC